MRGKIIYIILFTLLITSPSFTAQPLPEEVVLIGNPSAPDSIQKEEVKQIFLGKKTRWQDDSQIAFVIFYNKEVLTVFLKAYVGKTYSQYRNYWKKQVFTGKGRMPQSFKEVEELLNVLAETDGAISFLQKDDVDLERVKIISVE